MILALDYGSRYIGVAITDADEKLALRHCVIDQKREDSRAAITKIVEGEKVEKILVGVPISLSGRESTQTKVSRDFVATLRQWFGEGITVEEVDETLTSIEAERQIQFEGGSKDDAHAEAARIMLADYLQR